MKAIGLLLFVAIIIALPIGWVMNLITLIQWAGEITPEFIIRAIGIPVAIIGAIAGYV